MKNIYTLLLISLLSVGVGCQTAVVNTDTTSTTSSPEIVTNQSTETAVQSDIMQSDVAVGTYTQYDAEVVKQAATTGTAVLFFHAPWCPTCSALNKDIEAHLSDIPAGVTIFKTDYDSQTALKQKYGVTYQHTLVVVDAEGNQLKKWSGGNTLSSLLGKLN